MLIASVSQDDKDLVHEFVNSYGLSALISVGQDADQNYQNYILRGREMTSQLFYCRIYPSMECTGYKTMGKFEGIINTIIAHLDKMCQVLQVFSSNRYFGKSDQTKNPKHVNRILRNQKLFYNLTVEKLTFLSLLGDQVGKTKNCCLLKAVEQN